VIEPRARRRPGPIDAGRDLRRLGVDEAGHAELLEHLADVRRVDADGEARRVAVVADEPPAAALRRETIRRAFERDEPEAQRIGQDLRVEAADLPSADAELVGMQLHAG
jgi:hypothetical protein